MRLTWSCLSVLMLLASSSACEVHIGDADWDSGTWDDWDSRDDWNWNEDPWDSPSSPDGGTASSDSDAGTGADQGDAAMSDRADAGEPVSMFDAAVVMPGELPEDEPTITLGMVAEFLARGSCGALSDCMGAELLQDSLRGMDCVQFRTQVYANRELYWLAKSVAYGRVTFRPELLTACETDLLGLGCDVQSSRMPQSCLEALEGKALVDEQCAIDQECAADSYCNKGLVESCPGTCASLQSDGLPCLSSSECKDGLVCRARVCAVPLVEGDKCTDHLGYGECSPGLVCQGTGLDKFTCRSVESVYVGSEGDVCDKTDKLCKLGLVCQSQSATSVMGICAKPASGGEACKPSEPGQCASDHYCKDARANVTARAAAGEEGVCSELPADGEDCVAAVGCRPGAICSAVDSKCHSRKGVAEPCVENAECITGVCGDSGKCAAPLDCSP